MVKGLQRYVHGLFRRITIVGIVLLFAFILHRVSLSLHQEIIGAIIFVVLFTSSLLYYYINMFHAKNIRGSEFLVSLLSVFILTIVMFAIIYNEPVSNARGRFIENGSSIEDLPLSDALYFSTTTISTLGYGDIVPLGIYRYFAMAEVLLGLLYMGTILYFVNTLLGRSRG
jgi:potassium channel LctB